MGARVQGDERSLRRAGRGQAGALQWAQYQGGAVIVDSDVFPQAALGDNRSGRLTVSQQQGLRALSRRVRKSELSGALLAAVLGVVIFIAVKPSASGLVRVGVPIGCLIVAAFLLWRAIGGSDRLTRDMRNPQVESLEGPISRHVFHTSSEGSSSSTHYLDVAGKRFTVGTRAYQAAPDAGYVRIYFLPISRHVVNLERLPDRSLPEGTTPRTFFQDFKQALRSHDRARLDEVRAQIAGTDNALQGAVVRDPIPPSAIVRDPRPLAEAILGSWSNGPITAVFTANGTFTFTILGANQRSGHWSIDGDGKLVADLAGREQATDAWIVGDQLTVSLGDQAVTLNRAHS